MWLTRYAPALLFLAAQLAFCVFYRGSDNNGLPWEEDTRSVRPSGSKNRDLATTITIINATSSATPVPAPAPLPTTSHDGTQPQALAPALGTNFQEGVPFNFTNIFLLAGYCDINEPWLYGFVTAGVETLVASQIVCLENKKGLDWWTREYQLDALQEVERLAGDKLNETLVITIGVGLETDWSPVADLLRKGMAFFHAKEDPIEQLNFNLTEHGLSPNDVLYFYFQWDEVSAAERNGVELCRLKGGKKQLKIAKLLVGGRDSAPLDYRIHNVLESFRKACPDTKVIELWEMLDNATDATMKSTLLFNPLPDIIITGGDRPSAKILDIASKSLLPEEYDLIATTGWDDSHKDLLDQQKILTTVNQLVHFPNQGIWRAIDTVITQAQETGLNSTVAIQQAMDRGDGVTMIADTLTVSGDRTGYLISTLRAGYDPTFPPYKEVRVSTGLLGTSITKMDPFEGKFEVVLTRRTSWHDPRLVWNPIVYDGELSIDPEQIWTPRLYFQNEFTSEALFVAPAMVTNDGVVIMETNIVAQFLCPTTDGLRGFPFDTYNCSIDLGSPKGVTIDQKFGFEVVSTDPHYNTSWSTSLEDEGNNPEENPQNHHSQVVHYQLLFVRRPFTAYMNMILPAVIINMIGFMAFWIPDLAESVALGITSMLCSLAFRSTVQIPDTSEITWTETFMMVNISYQASVMLIIWCSYSSATRLGKFLNDCCKPIHPKNVASESKNLVSSIALLKKSNTERSKLENDLKKFQMEMEFEKEQAIPSGKVSATNPWERSNKALEFSGRSQDDNINFPEFEADLGESSNTDGANLGDSRSSLPAGTVHRPSKTLDVELAVHPIQESRHEKGVFAGTRRESNSAKLTKFMRRFSIASDNTDARFARERKNANVDWIGRWFVVPSYFIVMATLLFGGWGFK